MNKLLINSISGTALYVVNIAVAFLLSPVLLRALGNSAYGIWELLMSLVGYMGLLDLGIGSAIVRYVAVADGSHDQEKTSRVMATSLVFFCAVGLVGCIIFFLIGMFPEIFTGVEGHDLTGIRLLFYIFALNAVILFPMNVCVSILLGFQSHYFINFTRGVLIVVKSYSIYFYICSYNINVLIFISIVEVIYSFVSFAIFYSFMVFRQDIPKFSLRYASWYQFKDLLSFGAKNLVMMAASRLKNQSVPLIIASTLGVGNIVYFAFPNRLVQYAKGFSLAIGYPLTPYFSSAIGSGQVEKLRKSWLQITFILQIIMFIMPIVLWQYGEVFLHLWIGQEYAVAGRQIFRILVIGLVSEIFAVNGFRILTAKGTHGKCALLWLVLSALSIPAGVVGGKAYGIEGVAMGVTLATVAGNMATMMIACKSLAIPLWEYILTTLGKLFLPVIVTSAYSQVLILHVQVNGFMILFFHTLSVVFVYGLLVWICSIDRAVKAIILKNLQQKHWLGRG